jgi:hypothetical protein
MQTAASVSRHQTILFNFIFVYFFIFHHAALQNRYPRSVSYLFQIYAFLK